MIRGHWEKRFEKRLELSRSKEEDYGSKDIPNDNFHRMAELCRILKVDITKPGGVAQFYIVSKLDRMCNLLRDGRTPNNEGVEDTLADMQNYIDILQDILHGKRGYWYRTVPPQSPEDILQEGKESQVDISSDEFIVTVVKIVEAYKTTDGVLFLDRERAIHYQKALDRKDTITTWVEKHCCYEMSKQDVVDILVEHGSEIGI